MYLHYILALFRRNRFNVDGWKNDKTKIRNSYVWASPGKWLRQSVIQALAFEVGDADRIEDVIGHGANGMMTDFPQGLPRETEARMAVTSRNDIEEDEDMDARYYE